MPYPVRALFLGLAVWLLPFIVSVAAYPLHDTERPLFESIMAVALTTATLAAAIAYFERIEERFVRAGLFVGVLWYLISAAIDLVMFGFGPEDMRMPFADWMKDIGVTYLLIPVVTIGIGYLLVRRSAR